MHRLLQLTLDLFDPTPTAAPRDRQTKPAVPRKRKAPDAIQTVAAERPAELLDHVLSPAAFRHPRANREAVLGDSVVAFEFRRARRRNIGFVVGPEGLTVTAPKWVPQYEIDAAVKSKSAWIVKKLSEACERQRRIESARIEWKDGAVFPYLGEQVIVVLDPRHAFDEVGAVLNTRGEALPGMPRYTLHVGLAQNAQPQQVRDAVQAWLMRRARELFTERLDHFATQLGVA